MSAIDRRNFIKGAAGGMVAVMAGEWDGAMASKTMPVGRARVSLVKDEPRSEAVQTSLALLGINPVKGKDVLLKPNFNTADAFPASTHNDTLKKLIESLWAMGARSLTLGERSGPPSTSRVIAQKDVGRLCRDLDVRLINFEELPAHDWLRVKPPDSHWRNGFDVARPVLEAECVVCTCCLKTHGYGGVFTMSLKLSVGITHKKNMRELHGSRVNMRRMIAEINQVYQPDLILMDGMEVFTDGGPMQGHKKKAGVMAAATDRIALDAVGLAVLKELGANRQIMDRKIFAQEQIARAVELGLGVSGPGDIEIVAAGEKSVKYGEKLTAILRAES